VSGFLRAGQTLVEVLRLGRIATVGTGHVGLVGGTCLANSGHEVVCVDLDSPENPGDVPFYEPGLRELLHDNMQSGCLSFNTELAQALHASRSTPGVFQLV
jgi:UDPglucose 6-dehydrogenase